MKTPKYSILITSLLLTIIVLWFFRLFQPNELWNEDTHLVVVVNKYTNDTEWTKRIHRPIVVCNKTGEGGLCDTPNFGYEAGGYLKYIINHYDHLPRYVAFLHGHEKDWHQNEDIVSRLNMFDADACVKSYITLNNHWIWNEDALKDHTRGLNVDLLSVWKDVFQDELGPPPTEGLNHDCCAQFIVSREAILKHKRSSYEKWYRYVAEPADNKRRAIIIENVWHLIFGEQRWVDKDEYYKDFEQCFPGTQ